MSRLRIEPGACGMVTTVTVHKIGKKKFSVEVDSECEMAKRLGAYLGEMDFMEAFTKILDNPVYRGASACLKHVSCPVPSGILKALEVEAGLAVKKDVSMRFESDPDEDPGSKP